MTRLVKTDECDAGKSSRVKERMGSRGSKSDHSGQGRLTEKTITEQRLEQREGASPMGFWSVL